MKPKTINGSELRLGDRVCLESSPEWDTAIVKKLDRDTVHLFRPYGTTGRFKHTGGVICYVGIEEFSCARNAQFTLLSRGEIETRGDV